MTVEETLFQLKLHGWCLVENVIPESKVRGVRRSIEATAGGYARGGESIDIPDVLNVDQSFAPYLAHEAILGPLRALWGWLAQDPDMPPGTPERERLREETGLSDEELGKETALLPAEVYRALPEDVNRCCGTGCGRSGAQSLDPTIVDNRTRNRGHTT